ncbi:hypothetical protein Csa_003732 [Cucumis sativus]|uniref:Uncharacterized protein n=1 Tax=Cucumis sativus TaxID=3659 RepID=A0A0A0KKX0_CUCSA|nr:hypothetical protein Csa_003732 [Cucumis sativus]
MNGTLSSSGILTKNFFAMDFHFIQIHAPFGEDVCSVFLLCALHMFDKTPDSTSSHVSLMASLKD